MTNVFEGKILLKKIIKTKPSAFAKIYGGETFPNILGNIEFYDFNGTSVVVSTIHNLPNTNTNIFAFHIHEKGECDGKNFDSAGSHYGKETHPKHKGDMPVLFSNDGEAFMCFYTNKFNINEIVGKSIIIHNMPDDFTTQPAGNSGERIACGIITKIGK